MRPPFAIPQSGFWIDQVDHKCESMALVMTRSQKRSKEISQDKDLQEIFEDQDLEKDVNDDDPRYPGQDKVKEKQDNNPDPDEEAEYATSDHRYPCNKESCKRSSSSSSTGVFTPLDTDPRQSVDKERNFEDSFGRKAELFGSEGSMEEEQNKDKFCKRIKDYLEKGIIDDLVF